MNRSTFGMKYMNGSVIFKAKARYMNGEGFEILARTPAPKLLPLHPHPEVAGGGGWGWGWPLQTFTHNHPKCHSPG